MVKKLLLVCGIINSLNGSEKCGIELPYTDGSDDRGWQKRNR